MKPNRIALLFQLILIVGLFDLSLSDHSLNDSMSQTTQAPFTDQSAHQTNRNDPRKLPTISTSSGQPIRITVDTEEIKNQFPQHHEYFIKIFKVASNFFSKLIKVKQLTIPNKYNKTIHQFDKKLCGYRLISERDVIHGIENSDLHIYINQSNKTLMAEGGRCYFDQQIQRPTFGLMILNIKQICQLFNCENHLYFQQAVSTILHEIIHILGFSNHSIEFDSNHKEYLKNSTINNKPTTLIASPNVLNTARKYFDCSNLLGMPTENDGGFPGSYWETTTIGQEIMSPQGSLSIKLSVFTIALLKDIGFYEDVNENLAFPINWGKSKGCQFVTNAIDNNYEEFHRPQGNLGCSDEGGVEYMTDLNDFIDISPVIQDYSCQEEQSKLNQEKEKNYYLFGDFVGSKCFESNLVSPVKLSKEQQALLIQKKSKKDNISCYSFECLNNNSQIKIIFPNYPNDSIVCRSEEAGQIKQVFLENKHSGEIRCPKNYEQFCLSAACKNNCSMNGFCVKGKCTCNEGFSAKYFFLTISFA